MSRFPNSKRVDFERGALTLFRMIQGRSFQLRANEGAG
jgi:hypothetical protein